MQAGTQFTYPGGMKAWVHLSVCYIPRLLACLQTVTHPSSNHFIVTRSGVELMNSNVLTVTQPPILLELSYKSLSDFLGIHTAAVQMRKMLNLKSQDLCKMD